MLAVHLVYTVAELRGNVSGDALRWLDIIVQPSIEPCYRAAESGDSHRHDRAR